MAINSNIALQTRLPEIESPMNALAKASQVKNAMSQNRLFDMKVAESERQQQRQNALMQATRGAFDPATGRIDPGKYRSALGDLGDYAGIQEFDKTQAEQEKLSAEGDAKKFEIATKRFDYYKKALGSLAQDPGLSKDLVMQAGQSLVQQGILPAEMYQQSIQNLPDDIEQLRARLRQGVAQQLTPEQMLTVFSPKAEKIDNGQQIGYRDMNPNSPTYGQATGGAPVQKMQSPDSVASNAISIRGQNMTDARAREQATNSRGQVVTTADGGVVLVDQKAGTAQPVTGPDGKQIVGKMPGQLTPKQIADAQSKLQTVQTLRMQLKNLKGVRDKLGFFSEGKLLGKNPASEAGSNYDAALSAVQTTVRQLTRTPGEGAMSDYESRMATAQLPNRDDFPSSVDQKIQQLDDLVNVIESGYSGMLESAPNGGLKNKNKPTGIDALLDKYGG